LDQQDSGRTLAALLTVLLLCAKASALTIGPEFDRTITSDANAAAIETTITAAIAFYEASFADPVTVHFRFYEMDHGLGENSPLRGTFSYSAYRAALVAHQTSADDATALAHLPDTTDNPVNGNPNVVVALPLARALGLTSVAGFPDDDVIRLNTSICNLPGEEIDPKKYSLFAVVCHEMDEGLGIDSALDNLSNGTAAPTRAVAPGDLFRYDQTGARSFNTSLSTTAYFSLDGTTDLARFNQDEMGDYNDWYSPGGQGPQVQDAIGTKGTAPVPITELRVLDVIGYAPSPVVWVQYGLSAIGSGTYAQPYNTLVLGISTVPAGGKVMIKYPGSTPEKLTITKPMMIRSCGGSAIIGR
jgi:hypothetical protein